jgi:hypothetical protein
MIHPIAILRIHTTNGFQLRFGAPLAQASSQATKAHAKSQPLFLAMRWLPTLPTVTPDHPPSV